MKYEFAALTDVGQVRSNNEDSVFFNAELGLVVLADGMGGYNAGEVASGMATAFLDTEIRSFFKVQQGAALEPEVLAQTLSDGLQHVNAQVYQAAHTQEAYAGMGTTVVCGLLTDEDFVVAHLGDSRAYLLRGGELVQLTRDHSMLQEYLDMGLITPEQAPFCSWKNLVTRAVGVEQEVEPETLIQPVQVGDIFLLCSDGLSDMLRSHEIAALLKNSNNSLSERANDLIEAANEAGGRDNISVVLVEALADSEKQGLAAQLGRIFSKKKQ